MRINSIEFLLFSLIFFLVYFYIKPKYQKYTILIGSLIFCAYLNWPILLVIFFTSAVNYILGILINKRQSNSKKILIFAVSFNILLILSSKLIDSNFYVTLGLSFYSLRAITYIVGIHRKNINSNVSYVDFLITLIFFPIFNCGPIEPAKSIINQLEFPKKINIIDIKYSSWLILYGLFKKLYISDNCAIIVKKNLNSDLSLIDGGQVFIGMSALLFQIFADFSGYTDIARGISKLLGFKIMKNFNNPYFSKNPTELWSRWHISLSTWLRDYIFIPLSFYNIPLPFLKRSSKFRRVFNVYIVFLVAAFWHDLTFNFLIWGAYFATLIVLHQTLKPLLYNRKGIIWNILCHLSTLTMISFGWLFFYIESTNQLFGLISKLFTEFHWNQFYTKSIIQILFLNSVLYMLLYFEEKRNDEFFVFKISTIKLVTILTYMLFCLLFLGNHEGRNFLYYKF